MKWFKHFTDWHRDPVLADCTRRYGHVTVELFNLLKEVYAENYDRRDARGFASVRLFYIQDCLKIKQPLLKNIGDFLKNENRLDYSIENEVFLFYLPEFERLIGNWRQRRDHGSVATVLHKRGNEEEKREEEKIYEERKKEDSGGEVLVKAANDILDYFNKKTGKQFSNPCLIVSLLREGRKKEDFLRIIDVKSEDDFFRKNRRLFNLQTFFSGDHFEKYLQEYHDREKNADIPSGDTSLPVPENKEKEIAYQRFLKNEYASLQAAFIDLLKRHELLDYVVSCGFDEKDAGFAVVSFEDNVLKIFTASSFPGYTTSLGKYLKEEAGITLEYVWKVPDGFDDPETFNGYVNQKEAV